MRGLMFLFWVSICGDDVMPHVLLQSITFIYNIKKTKRNLIQNVISLLPPMYKGHMPLLAENFSPPPPI